MKGEKKSVNELLTERNELMKKREAIDIAMNEIADKCHLEKREFSAEENVKYMQLQSDFNALGREISMNVDTVNYLTSINNIEKPVKSQNQLLREFFQGIGGKKEVVLNREANFTTSDLETGGMIPLTIKDVMPPLEMGLIFDKVGIKVSTGVVGNIQWPSIGAFEASIQGETVKLNDSSIDLSKVAANKVRLGISIKISNQAINDTNTDLVGLIKDEFKKAIPRTLNRVCFSHENFSGGLHGPFAGAKASGTFAGALPTLKELLQLKGEVAANGVDMSGFCYVMSEVLKAQLEGEPTGAGGGRMIIENGKINGYPVFCTEFINYGSDKSKDAVEHVGAGAWSYLPTNQHGEARLIIDPYTLADQDLVKITLNADWSMTTLKAEAFAHYKCAGA